MKKLYIVFSLLFGLFNIDSMLWASAQNVQNLAQDRRLTAAEIMGLYSKVEALRAKFPCVCDRGSYVEFHPGSLAIKSKEDLNSVKRHLMRADNFLQRYGPANYQDQLFRATHYSLAALLWDFQRHIQEIVPAPAIKGLGPNHFADQELRIKFKKHAEKTVIDVSTASRRAFFEAEYRSDRLQ